MGGTECRQIASLPEPTRTAAGAVVTTVCAAERAAAAIRDRLTALDPWTAGTARRARRVLARLSESLDGDGCRLARALRQQRCPWYLDDDPLRATLRALANLTDQAAELATIVERARELAVALARLKETVEGEVPGAFARLITLRGLTAEALDEAMTMEEISVAAENLDAGARRLSDWRSDLQSWLAAEDSEEAAEVLRSSPSGGPVRFARLEERYELVLRLGQVRREPLLRETSQTFRNSSVAHLSVVAGVVGARVDEGPYRLAVDAYGASAGACVSSTEISIWRECLAAYHRRATPGRQG